MRFFDTIKIMKTSVNLQSLLLLSGAFFVLTQTGCLTTRSQLSPDDSSVSSSAPVMGHAQPVSIQNNSEPYRRPTLL